MNKITIIIPIYNAQKYIDTAIQNILKQSYINFELILINDGSTDSSQQICESYKTKDNRIILVTQVNKGPASARNVGIKIAKGDYIGFVDADDEIPFDYFENLIKAANLFKADIIISDVNNDNDKNITILTNCLPKNKLLNPNEIKKYVLEGYYNGKLGNIAPLFNKLYHSNFLKVNNLLIDESRIRAEDYWFNFHAFSKAENCVALDYAGYVYKVSTVGSVMKTFREKQYDDFSRTRTALLEQNKVLSFKIDYGVWDTEFVNNANEFILLAVKNTRMDIVRRVLQDKTFNKAMHNFIPTNLHTTLIKLCQKMRLNFLTIQIYKLWATKII